jgi:hypothetical protein
MHSGVSFPEPFHETLVGSVYHDCDIGEPYDDPVPPPSQQRRIATIEISRTNAGHEVEQFCVQRLGRSVVIKKPWVSDSYAQLSLLASTDTEIDNVLLCMYDCFLANKDHATFALCIYHPGTTSRMKLHMTKDKEWRTLLTLELPFHERHRLMNGKSYFIDYDLGEPWDDLVSSIAPSRGGDDDVDDIMLQIAMAESKDSSSVWKEWKERGTANIEKEWYEAGVTKVESVTKIHTDDNAWYEAGIKEFGGVWDKMTPPVCCRCRVRDPVQDERFGPFWICGNSACERLLYCNTCKMETQEMPAIRGKCFYCREKTVLKNMDEM